MRARDIKPGFFLNEYLAACSPHARLLFIGLWMLADREGRLEERPKQIKAKIFPFENVDLEGLLEELAKSPEGDHPFIQRYEVKGKSYIQVVNFLKHQSPHPKERPSEIPPPPELTAENREKSLTSREISRQVSDNYRKLSDRQVANHSDILTPDSLTPDILTPYSLIADSLTPSKASPKGEAQTPLRAPPHPEEQKRTRKTVPQSEDAFSEVPPPQREEAPLDVPPPERARPSQPEEALSFPPPRPAGPPQPGKAQRSLRSPPHPAVEAYKKAFFYYPRHNLYSLIAEKVGEDEEDLRLWAKACQSWAAHGWNPKNIAGLLEYYEKRGFLEKTTISRGIPKFSRAAQAAIALAEKYEREEQDEKDEGKEKDRAEEGDEGISSFFKAFTPSPFSHPP